jgi:hypothetical protein
MLKRLMVVVIGAGIGTLLGLFVAAMGAGTPALVVCAGLGAIVPQFFLGAPGR